MDNGHSASKRRRVDDIGDDRKRLKQQIWSFPVQPLSQFDPSLPENKVRPPPFQQPAQLTTFSYDGQRNLMHDDSQMVRHDAYRLETHLQKWYYPPDLAQPRSLQNDLSHGFEKFIKRDESIPEHIDALLEALMKYRETSDTIKADIITWRGIITKILTTPYTRNEPWSLNATLLDNAIYIEEEAQPGKKSYGSNPQQQLMTFWGYKFESLSTVSKAPSLGVDAQELADRVESPVNTNEQWCSVVRTKLGRSRIVLGGEVDCVMEVNGTKPATVELKTSKMIQSDRDEASFERHKLLKFWAQSFLLAIPYIIVGFRDQQGFVQTLQKFKTLEIPRLVRGKPGLWDPNVCLVFAEHVLHWIRKTVMMAEKERAEADDASAKQPRIYRIEWKEPWRELSIRLLDTEPTESPPIDDDPDPEPGEVKPPSRWGFLTANYAKWKQEHIVNDPNGEGMI